MRLIQIAHTSERNTGVQPPQSFSAFNVYAEEQSILNANQSLVQQIISSGLAAPGDTLAILGILLASGQVSSSLFSRWDRAVWRRAHAVRAGSGRGHGQLQPELLRLARAGSDSVAPGRRRGGNAEGGRALSHPDLLLLEFVGQRSQYSGADRRGSLRQPVFAALISSGSGTLGSAGAIPGPGPDPEDNPQRDAQQRRRAHTST